MPNFEHPDIQEASEQIDGSENLDQTIDVLYSLLLKLDEEYDVISTDIESESNKMISEFHVLSNILLDEILIPYLILDDSVSDYIVDATVIRHMMHDFGIDGSIDEDLMNNLSELKSLRKERIADILASKPEFTIYPNPVASNLNVNINFPYRLLGDGNTATVTVVEYGGGGVLPDYNPYVYLPSLDENEFDGSTNGSFSDSNLEVAIYDMQGNKVADATPNLDSHGNIGLEEDVSSLSSGAYFIRVVTPSIDMLNLGRGGNYTEIPDTVTSGVYTSQFVKL